MTEACAGTASISAGRFFEEPPSKNGVSSASALRQSQRRWRVSDMADVRVLSLRS